MWARQAQHSTCVSGVYQVRISHGLGRVSDTCISDGMRCLGAQSAAVWTLGARCVSTWLKTVT